MTESLGNLVKVKIRTRWPNEAADFTPWLALEENMSQLGDAIGLELETERTEVAVCPLLQKSFSHQPSYCSRRLAGIPRLDP